MGMNESEFKMDEIVMFEGKKLFVTDVFWSSSGIYLYSLGDEKGVSKYPSIEGRFGGMSKLKVRVDVEYLNHLKEEIRKINRINLNDIDWYEDGKKLEIKDEIISEFDYTGLSNEDFIDSEFYKHGWDQEKICKIEAG